MRELKALTPEEFARAERRLRNPAAGSRIEAAKKHGIDLTLVIEQLRLSPAERVRRLEDVATALEKARGVTQGKRAR